MKNNELGKNLWGKRRGEKCLMGKIVSGEKCHGENCLGKNVVGKIVFWGKMLQSLQPSKSAEIAKMAIFAHLHSPKLAL